MDRLQAMRTFVAVADVGGFADAGRRLRMSPPAVTRAVAALEAAIGARLLVRTTRSVKLTEAGARYLDDCRRILAEVSDAEASAAGVFATPAGTLTVTAPVLFGRMYVLPLVSKYLSTHAGVSVQLMFLDRVISLVEEGVDVAVRIGRLPDSDLSASRVGSVRRVICASPDYLAARGAPQTPAELADHDVVAVTSAWASPEWRFGRSRRTAVTVRPRLLCNLNEAAIAAAIDGRGLTRVLSYQVAPAVAEGRLKIVLEDFEEEPLPVHIVHAEGRSASAKIRSFVDFVVERLRADEMIN